MSLINLGLTDQEDFLQYIGFNKHHILHSDVTDGFRITIDNNNIIHLRPSGNALSCVAMRRLTRKRKHVILLKLFSLISKANWVELNGC